MATIKKLFLLETLKFVTDNIGGGEGVKQQEEGLVFCCLEEISVCTAFECFLLCATHALAILPIFGLFCYVSFISFRVCLFLICVASGLFIVLTLILFSFKSGSRGGCVSNG